MSKAVRRLSYEEFAATLPEVLEAVAEREETVLVERHGKTFAVALAGPEPEAPRRKGPRMAEFDENGKLIKVDPEVAREALRRSAGALKGVDIQQLKADLRIQRQQDSSGRPG